MYIPKQPPGTTVEDTAAPFELFAPQGYYRVGNKIFNHKIYALKEATRTGIDPTWHFNEDCFNTFDWQTPLRVPLTELYAQRAQQLRDKYDYLILWWSGGADSTSMLQAFIHNNITLDEVFVGWPVKLTEGKYTPSFDTKVANFVSEYDLVIKPGLKWLSDNYPNIKISLVDTSDSVKRKDHNESLFLLTETFQYLNDQRVESIEPIIRERSRGGRSVANIFGISPPELAITQDILSMQFSDLSISPFGKSESLGNDVLRTYENFYTTPDMPEILREMSHAVLDFVTASPRYKNLFDRFEFNKSGKLINTFITPYRQQARKILNTVFHPNYNHNNFQAYKQNFVIMTSGWWDIFYKNPAAEEFVEPHRHAALSELKMISPKYFTFRQPNSTDLSHLESFVRFKTKFYPIGKINAYKERNKV